jgi:hypothetical protein
MKPGDATPTVEREEERRKQQRKKKPLTAAKVSDQQRWRQD